MSRVPLRVLAGVALSTLLVLGSAGSASAGKGDPPLVTTGGTGESTQGFNAQQGSTQHNDPAPATGGDSGGTTPTSYGSSSPAEPPPPPTWEQMMDKDPNADLSTMPGAVDSCGSNWGGDGWNAQYAEPTPCAPTDDPEPGDPPARPRVTTEMVVQAASVTAPTNPPHVEPGNVSYVNIPNNYWTESPTVRDSITLLGQTIPLVWTPTGTTWDFGDGGSATGDGIEGAEVGAPGAIEHSYSRQGSYDISTSTTYNLTFVLPGQGAQTVALTSPPSPPVTLPVREIQTVVDATR